MTDENLKYPHHSSVTITQKKFGRQKMVKTNISVFRFF